MAISPDGRYAYVAEDYNNTIGVINLATDIEVNEIPVCANPFGVAINHAGTHAYVSCTSGSFTIISLQPPFTAALKASNLLVDSGQTETLSVSISGGISPYTVNFFNVTGNRQLSSSIYAPWAPNKNPYPTNSYGQSCVTASGSIYCIGGYDTQQDETDNSTYYAPILGLGMLGILHRHHKFLPHK